MKIQTVDDYIKQTGTNTTSACRTIVSHEENSNFWYNHMMQEQEEIKKEMHQQFGEWQLCPKCNGEGIVFSTSYGTAGNVTKVCGVCNGSKILARPIIK